MFRVFVNLWPTDLHVTCQEYIMSEFYTVKETEEVHY